MDQKRRRFVLWAFLIYASANILVYLISHVATLIKSNLLGGIFEYLALYSLTALEFLAPPIIATLLLIIYTHKGIEKTISAAVIISSARIFYVFPYLYVQLFYRYGSFDAIILSLLSCLRTVILTASGAFFSLCVGLIVLRLVLKKSHTELVPMLPDILERKSSTDFLSAENLPLLIFVLLRFALEIVTEIVYTVSFFISYGSDYSAIEILTMLFNFILLFVLLVVSYLLACRIKNAVNSLAVKEKITETDTAN